MPVKYPSDPIEQLIVEGFNLLGEMIRSYQQGSDYFKDTPNLVLSKLLELVNEQTIPLFNDLLPILGHCQAGSWITAFMDKGCSPEIIISQLNSTVDNEMFERVLLRLNPSLLDKDTHLALSASILNTIEVPYWNQETQAQVYKKKKEILTALSEEDRNLLLKEKRHIIWEEKYIQESKIQLLEDAWDLHPLQLRCWILDSYPRVSSVPSETVHWLGVYGEQLHQINDMRPTSWKDFSHYIEPTSKKPLALSAPELIGISARTKSNMLRPLDWNQAIVESSFIDFSQ